MKVQRQKVTTYEEEVPKTLEVFLNWEFTSGAYTGEDFKIFTQLFKKRLLKVLPEGTKLIKFNPGHYEFFGFIEKNGKFVYFSISDVRGFPNDWYYNILVRTAKSDKDYTGGSNHYTTLDNFPEIVSRLLK